MMVPFQVNMSSSTGPAEHMGGGSFVMSVSSLRSRLRAMDGSKGAGLVRIS